MPLAPLAVAGISAGVGIAGDLLSSKDQGLPDWLIDELTSYAQQNRTDGFLPDKAVFDQNLNTQLAEFLSQIPAGEEAFNTDLASRGIFQSGEAPKNLYSSVYAPIARAGASAVGRSNVQFAQLTQQGNIAAAQNQQQKYRLLIDSMLNRQPSTLGSIGNALSDAGGLGLQYGFLSELGLIGGDG